MKPRSTQFDVRENTASSRQHAPRLAVSPSLESVRRFEGPHDEAGAPLSAPRELEVFDLPLTETPNEATGGKVEKAAQSRTAMVADAESGNNGARSTDFEPLLDVAEAAQLLRMHPKTLRVKARNGIIPGIQIGRLWRFRASTLNRWLGKFAS
jgi:excisionase family DNA binding protein